MFYLNVSDSESADANDNMINNGGRLSGVYNAISNGKTRLFHVITASGKITQFRYFLLSSQWRLFEFYVKKIMFSYLKKLNFASSLFITA